MSYSETSEERLNEQEEFGNHDASWQTDLQHANLPTRSDNAAADKTFQQCGLTSSSELLQQLQNPEPKPQADKPRADKPQADKPQADKPQADKPQADKPLEPAAQKPAEAKPQPGRPIERQLEDGSREIRAVDAGGNESILRTRNGVAIYCKDHSGEWRSENGRQWSGPQGRNWTGRVEMQADGTMVQSSEGGTITTLRASGERQYNYRNGASFTERPTSDGGRQSTLRNPQGREFTITTNRDGTATSVTDDSGTWTSRDGHNWQRNNGAGREPSNWTGTIRFTPNGDYESTSDSGRVVTQGRDGVRTTVMPDRTRMVEQRDGRIDLYDRTGRHEGTYLAADQTHSASGMQRENYTGGTIVNNSGRPLLVMASEGAPKRSRFYVLPAGQQTPAGTDADGIVTDPRYQPRTAPDGRLLVPAHIPPTAEAHKIVDGITGTVTSSNGQLSMSTDADWSLRARVGQTVRGGAVRVGNMTGGEPMMPHRRDNTDTVSPQERQRIQEAYRQTVRQEAEALERQENRRRRVY